MANRKKEVYKPKPMTEGKRNLIQGLLQEYDIQVAQMRKLFLKLKEEGKIILMASHNKEDIKVLWDVVVSMENGKVISREEMN